MKILIVEDRDENIEAAIKTLKDKGIDYRVAKSFWGAIDLLCEEEFDAGIFDYEFPFREDYSEGIEGVIKAAEDGMEHGMRLKNTARQEFGLKKVMILTSYNHADLDADGCELIVGKKIKHKKNSPKAWAEALKTVL